MRRQSEATRQKIIDAAYEQIWRAGFNRTSLDTIAARADVTKRTLYSYFRSKDDLLAAVLAHRVIVSPAARLRELSSDRLVQEIIQNAPVPGGDYQASIEKVKGKSK